MKIIDMFEIGGIMEMDEKAKSIKVLDDDDCVIVGKALNKNKIILNMKRASDNSEGNVFVRLKEKYESDFATSKKLFISKKLVGMTLGQFKNFNIEDL